MSTRTTDDSRHEQPRPMPPPNPEWFSSERGLWFYEHPYCPVANVRGRGLTKDLAYRHWVMLVKPYL